MKIQTRKLKANIVISVIIFILTFLVLCICAIDAGHVVLARYKVQKLTETTALYMASYLNSKPVDERNENALKPLKERFEKLYSSTLSGYYNFKIKEIELKDEALNPKVKVSAEANIPTIFLRYTGVGYIKILQVSYAKAEAINMPMINSDVHSYTFEANDIITDKPKDDIKVEYDGDYFIFAGIKGGNGDIFWSDASYAAKTTPNKTILTFGGDVSYELGCIQKSAEFDFSDTSNKTIGLIKYIKIYKADCSKEDAPDDEEADSIKPAESEEDKTGDNTSNTEDSKDSKAEKADADTDSAADADTDYEDGSDEILKDPVVTVLNSVKLIRKKDF